MVPRLPRGSNQVPLATKANALINELPRFLKKTDVITEFCRRLTTKLCDVLTNNVKERDVGLGCDNMGNIRIAHPRLTSDYPFWSVRNAKEIENQKQIRGLH